MNSTSKAKILAVAAALFLINSCGGVYHAKISGTSDSRAFKTTRVGIKLDTSTDPAGNLQISVQRLLFGAVISKGKAVDNKEIQIGKPEPCEKCKVNVVLGINDGFSIQTDLAGKVVLKAESFTIDDLLNVGGERAVTAFQVEGQPAGSTSAFWALKWHEAQAWESLQRNVTVEAIDSFNKRFSFTSHKDELARRRDCLNFAHSLAQCSSQPTDQSAAPILDPILSAWREKFGVKWPGRVITSDSWRRETSSCKLLLVADDQSLIDKCESPLTDREEYLLSEWKKEQLEEGATLLKEAAFDDALIAVSDTLVLFPDDKATVILKNKIESAKARAEAIAAVEAKREADRLAAENFAEEAEREAESKQRYRAGWRHYRFAVELGMIKIMLVEGSEDVQGSSDYERSRKACNKFCASFTDPSGCSVKCSLACSDGVYSYNDYNYKAYVYYTCQHD